MSRFYASPQRIRGNIITIDGEEAHHILDVMRLKKLDKVTVFDGTGREYAGFIREIKRKALTVEIIQTRSLSSRDKSTITLIQAIPKKDKMDYIVEKATELGVGSIIPVFTARSIPDWDASKKARQEARWRKIGREAAKQCARSDIPDVKYITEFNDIIRDMSDYDLALIAALSDGSIMLKECLAGFKGGKVAVAIGPEGDFTPREIEDAKASGFKPVSLGKRVLKSDTAGLAVLAVLNYEFSTL
jgi:16S rRNA (uracil1498-N3)-methyltransferase